MDDASPDGTQEIAKQLAGVYGDDKIVRVLRLFLPNGPFLKLVQVLKPRSGKLGLGYYFM